MKGYAKYVASIGLVFPCAIHAMGLGNLTVASYLNQPLKATIDLTLDEDTVLNGIKVRLASVEAFKNAGLERPYRLSKLNFSATMLDGKPVILITSQDRMSEPFLNVLLDVTWAEGQLYRAYAILLDPPGYELTPSAVSKNSFDRNVQAYHANKQRYLAAKRHTTSSLSSTGVYGPTKSTDDLWDIALRYKPENASINQVMLGIFRLNPTAFINGNINSLKQGVTLKLPSTETVLLVDKNTAENEVHAHMGAWKNKQSMTHVADLSAKPQEDLVPEIEASNQAATAQMDLEQIPNSDTEEPSPEKLKTATATSLPNGSETSVQQEMSSQNTMPTVVSSDDIRSGISAGTTDPQHFKLNMAKSAEKEPLFDDFISIPPVLKQIIKPQEKSGTVPVSMEQKIRSAKVQVNAVQSTTPLNAEVAIAVSAIETVKESNLLLRQQVEGLLKQNELLKQQITVLSKQDNQLASKIDSILKVLEQDYQITMDGKVLRRQGVKQSHEQTHDGLSAFELLGLIFFLTSLAVGGVFVFLYVRQQWKKTAATINDDTKPAYTNEHLGQVDIESHSTNSVTQENVKDNKIPKVKTYYKAEISVTEDDEELPFVSEKDQNIVESSGSKDLATEAAPETVILEAVSENKDEKEFDLLDLEFEFIKEEPLKAEKYEQSKMQTPLGEGLSLVVRSEDIEQSVTQPSVGKVNISTQIALAETYIAMEDWQSANESLALVIKQGNESEIAKAKQLLKKIP